MIKKYNIRKILYWIFCIGKLSHYELQMVLKILYFRVRLNSMNIYILWIKQCIYFTREINLICIKLNYQTFYLSLSSSIIPFLRNEFDYLKRVGSFSDKITYSSGIMNGSTRSYISFNFIILWPLIWFIIGTLTLINYIKGRGNPCRGVPIYVLILKSNFVWKKIYA